MMRVNRPFREQPGTRLAPEKDRKSIARRRGGLEAHFHCGLRESFVVSVRLCLHVATRSYAQKITRNHPIQCKRLFEAILSSAVEDPLMSCWPFGDLHTVRSSFGGSNFGKHRYCTPYYIRSLMRPRQMRPSTRPESDPPRVPSAKSLAGSKDPHRRKILVLGLRRRVSCNSTCIDSVLYWNKPGYRIFQGREDSHPGSGLSWDVAKRYLLHRTDLSRKQGRR
jgi:hypothetical protein